jgi:thioredoxin reductase (NADPH)
VSHPEQRDVVIVGAGIAGLTAATYLGRFRRPVLIISGGQSRAEWIPESHNIPGFTRGVGGAQFVAQLKEQAERYGADILPGQVHSIGRVDSGFALHVDGATIHSRYVILGTGVQDHLPALAGAGEALLRSVLRVCPVCDGYEAIDKRIAVIGDGERGEREAEFLQTFSTDVTLLYVGTDADRGRRQRLRSRGIDLIETELTQLKVSEKTLDFTTRHGATRSFDVFYTALGCSPRMQLAGALGARCDDNNALEVDSHQQTSIEGLYAAGDVVRGLNQVVIAAAEAALAAADIHNRLRRAGH